MSLTADSGSMVTVQEDRVLNIWIGTGRRCESRPDN